MYKILKNLFAFAVHWCRLLYGNKIPNMMTTQCNRIYTKRMCTLLWLQNKQWLYNGVPNDRIPVAFMDLYFNQTILFQTHNSFLQIYWHRIIYNNSNILKQWWLLHRFYLKQPHLQFSNVHDQIIEKKNFCLLDFPSVFQYNTRSI